MSISRGIIRNNWWILFSVFWAQWIIFNFTGPGAWIGPVVIKQLLSGPTTRLNIIFPVTWMSAVTSFFIILFMLREKTSIINALSISAASQLGAAFFFEFIFSIVALLRYGHPILMGNPYYVLVGFSWLIMPIVGIGFWSINRIFYISLGVFYVGFTLWIFAGFPILDGFTSIVLNYVTKISAFSIMASIYIRY